MRCLILCICLLNLSFLSNAQSAISPSPAFLNLLNDYPNVRDFTISENGKEAYFSAQSPLGELSVIMRIKNIDDRWTTPELASFSGKYMDLEPFLSLDGLRIYFASNRPLEGIKVKDFDIWYVDRVDHNSSWSDPVNLGPPVNTEQNEFYPSLSTNKNLYFTSDSPDTKGKDDIYLSFWKDGKYDKPISLSDSINSTGYEFNAFIAPDESFLLFSGYNRKDGQGSGDLYISFHKKDNSWSHAKNLGSAINSKHMDYCPFVNVTTNKMYFTSKRSMLSTPEEGFNSSAEFLDHVSSYENGLSRIYVVPFTDFFAK